MTRWYEDVPVDTVFDLGEHTFDEAEIIRFGKLYDPQYMHLSAEEAKYSQFGGLIASGWHTVCVGHRMMVDRLFVEEKLLREQGEEPGVSGPSPGVNKMEFTTPVRPGDTITYTLRVTGKRRSNSLPGWGLLFNHISGVNQKGDMVYQADLVGFSKLRDFKPGVKLRLLLWASKNPLLKRILRR